VSWRGDIRRPNRNCADRTYRKVACGSLVLMRAGDLPGDPEVEEFYSLDRVFQWLQNSA
jgi:hypothetical protein